MTVGPCARCARHVRVGSARCPFCGAGASEVAGGAVRAVSRRELTRAAVFASAAVVMGCGSSEPETADDGTSSGGGDDPGGGGDDPGGGGTDPGGGGGGSAEVPNPECADDPRRCRQLPPCVYDGTCPAPPYGAPPADTLV